MQQRDCDCNKITDKPTVDSARLENIRRAVERAKTPNSANVSAWWPAACDFLLAALAAQARQLQETREALPDPNRLREMASDNRRAWFKIDDELDAWATAIVALSSAQAGEDADAEARESAAAEVRRSYQTSCGARQPGETKPDDPIWDGIE